MEVIFETSKELSKMGVQVHVFTPFEDSKVIDNVFIHKIPSMASNFGFERRFYSLMRKFYSSPFIVKNLLLRKKTIESAVSSLVKNLLPRLKEFDLDILQGEQEIPAMACISIGKKLDIPVVAHIRNFWPEECVDTGLIKRNISTYQVLHQMVGHIVYEADIVFTVSNYARQFLKKEYGVNENKIVEIPRGARSFLANVDYTQKEPSAVYSGSISPHENLSLFIKSMPLVHRKVKNCSFYITGKGNYIPKLKRIAKQCSANVRFLWFPKKTDLQSFLSQCSVGVIPWANTISRQFGFPIKMLNYLSVGLPVVITDVGEWSNLVKNERLGVVVKPTPESLANGIIELLCAPTVARECGERGMRLIKERYNWENSAKVIYNEYSKMCYGP